MIRKGALLAALAVALPATSTATVLTFDIANLTDGDYMPQQYGDYVTSGTMGDFSYGEGSGFTPNVAVQYLGLGTVTELNFWTTGYSDLTNVVEYEPDGENGFEIWLMADPGFLVFLESFDLGNWSSAVTLPGLSVRDENDQVLWIEKDISVPDYSLPHLSFSFAPTLKAQTLKIHVDTTDMGGASDNMGLDNIAFAQAVPEPASLAVLAVGALALLRRRQR